MAFNDFSSDVASDVGVNFKNVGVLSIESSLFYIFHYTFLQTKHQKKKLLMIFYIDEKQKTNKYTKKKLSLTYTV